MLFMTFLISLFAINSFVISMDYDHQTHLRTKPTSNSFKGSYSYKNMQSTRPDMDYASLNTLIRKTHSSNEHSLDSTKETSPAERMVKNAYNTAISVPRTLSQVTNSGVTYATKVAAYGFAPIMRMANALEAINAQPGTPPPSWPSRNNASDNFNKRFEIFDSHSFVEQELSSEKFLKKEELQELVSFFRNNNFDINKFNKADLVDISSAIVDKIYGELDAERANKHRKPAAIDNNGLVIDSIEPDANWKTSFDVSDEPQDICIRKIQSYAPSNIKNSNNKIVVIVTHGTFGSGTSDYFKDKKFDNKKEIQNYRHFKRFATWYGFTHKKQVDLLSMKWTGCLFDTYRFEAADYLSNYLKDNYTENDQLVFLSHSHGCNVVNNMSGKLQRPIDLIIHFACPNRHKEAAYQPQNFKQLIHFYSAKISLLEGDITEPAGRLTLKDIASYLMKNTALYGAVALASIAECEMMANVIYKAASANFEIDKQSIKNTLLPDNYFLPQDNAIVIGLKTRINGKAPWHSRVPDVAQLLPELMTKIYREYPAHVAYSFRGDLHMEGDGRHHYSSNNPIKISNLQIALPHFLPKSIPFIVVDTSHIPTEYLPEFYKKMQLRDLQKISLDHWLAEEDPIIDPLVKPYDEHNRMIALQTKDNTFTAQDLENERKESAAEAPSYTITECKPTFIQDIN